MNAQRTPDGWEVHSWLGPRMGVGYYVCHRRFAGYDWLLDKFGDKRKFKTREAALAAIAKAGGTA